MTRSTAFKADISKSSNYVSFSLDEVKLIIEQTLQEHTNILLNEIKSLKQEVTDLKQSNIDMVRLLTTGKCFQQVSDNENAFISRRNQLDLNSSIETTSSSDTIVEVQSFSEKSVNNKKHQHTNTTQKHPHKNAHATAKYSGRMQNVIVGTSSADTTEEFSASNRRLWLYVGRCKPNSRPEHIKAYLEKRSPGHTFEVTKLPSLGRNSSYRVEADLELQDVLYTPSHWPKDVLVKRFKFRPENKSNTERPF